jgi:tetratricopeptide (TPR) repeat protein
MILENTVLLFKLYLRPLATMSRIIDEGNWGYGIVAAAIVSLILQFTIAAQIYSEYEAVPTRVHQMPAAESSGPFQQQGAEDEYGEGQEAPRQVQVRQFIRRRPLPIVGNYGWWFFSFSPFSILSTVLMLAVLYVPITILVMIIFEPLGTFGVILKRDYGPLLTCTLMAWAAAHLPAALFGLALKGIFPEAETATLFILIWMLAKLYFAFLMVCALRTVFGTSFGNALGTICFSWLSIFLESFLLLLASPFILFLAYSYFRGDINDIGSIFRGRQSFRRNLQAATINPKDAEANYQLGLIYQQRRQYQEAIERFRKAIEIDPREIDAHYQLGRIAREQNQLQDAINHFNSVVTQDEKHSLSEIWREIGATYGAASMHEEAQTALERYIERRPYDPEGLYHLGATYKNLGRAEKAEEMFERCIDAVKTLPHYRSRIQSRKWRKLAEEALRGK